MTLISLAAPTSAGEVVLKLRTSSTAVCPKMEKALVLLSAQMWLGLLWVYPGLLGLFLGGFGPAPKRLGPGLCDSSAESDFAGEGSGGSGGTEVPVAPFVGERPSLPLELGVGPRWPRNTGVGGGPVLPTVSATVRNIALL